MFALIGFGTFPFLYLAIVYASELGEGEWKYIGVIAIMICNHLSK